MIRDNKNLQYKQDAKDLQSKNNKMQPKVLYLVLFHESGVYGAPQSSSMTVTSD